MLRNIIPLFFLILGLSACDSGIAERTTDDPDKVTNSSPDGVFAKGGGETSDWEDQSARKSGVTTDTWDVDGKGASPVERAQTPDSIEYIRTPRDMSTSPVEKKTTDPITNPANDND